MAELTPEQLAQEQQRLDLINKQNEAAKDLLSTYEKMAKSRGTMKKEDKEILDLSKQIVQSTSNLASAVQKRISGTASVKDLTKSIKQLEADIVKNKNISASIQDKLNQKVQNSVKNAREANKNLVENQKNITRELQNQDNIQDEIERIKRAQGPIDQEALNAKREELRSSRAALDYLENERKKLETKKQTNIDLARQAKTAAKAHEDSIKDSEEELELSKEALKQKQKEGILDGLKKKFRVDEIKELFTIEGLLMLMLDHALLFNKISVKTSKDLGYGADQADRVATNLVDIAQNAASFSEFNGNNVVTLKNLGEAMSDLNTATGGVAEYSADALTTQIMLTKQFGLTGEEAAGIYKASVLTGKSSKVVNEEMAAAFANTRNMVRGSANFKATMAEAAKVSGQLAANFKNNPAEITKAVVQAQALGTTLEKTKNQGESLLNFESSIENELKAELLTGQQMNLERARAAALQGDQVTLMKELANQGMTIEKFQSMNVLAQKSFAEALGLSADELSDQLNKQKIAQEQGKSLAEITAEEALEAEKRQEIQDKFNDAVDKLKDMIGNLVAGPLSMFLDGLTSALTIIGYIVKPIEWIADLAGWIGKTFAGWASALGPVGIILKVIAGIAIVIAAYGAYAALAWIPVVGPILGAAAAIAVLAKGYSALTSAKSAGDMISPADGKTQVSTKEGGLFELSKNDDVLAGPGLAKAAKGGGGESITPTIDLTPMIAAINQVKASVDRLYSKDSSVHMDGKKVGTTLSQNSHKVA